MEKKVNRREFLKTSVATGVVLSAGALLSLEPNAAHAAELQPIQLQKPDTAGGNALLKLLEKRSSAREFAPDPLSAAHLSGLLWAAFGINRTDGKRTAPSARNRQEIDVYVALPKGLYLYDAKANTLKPIVSEDIGGLTGTQGYVKQAPANLVYVADMSKVNELTDEEKTLYPGADTGFIAENVYLYCAAEGLACVVRALIDRPVLAKAMKLRPDQKIMLAHSIGYPKK
jgi:nitroreductase